MKAELRWIDYRRIGSQFYNQVPKNLTLREIGLQLGCSYQTIHEESLVALGKLIHRLRLRMIPSVPSVKSVVKTAPCP